MLAAREGLAGFSSEEGLGDLLVQFRRLSLSDSKLPLSAKTRYRRQGEPPSLESAGRSRMASSGTLRGACPSYFSEQEGKLEKPICLAVLKHMRNTLPTDPTFLSLVRRYDIGCHEAIARRSGPR